LGGLSCSVLCSVLVCYSEEENLLCALRKQTCSEEASFVRKQTCSGKASFVRKQTCSEKANLLCALRKQTCSEEASLEASFVFCSGEAFLTRLFITLGVLSFSRCSLSLGKPFCSGEEANLNLQTCSGKKALK
jgi:hypothetical protein